MILGGVGSLRGPSLASRRGRSEQRTALCVTSLRLQGRVCSFLFLEAVMLAGRIEGSILAVLTASSKAAWLLGYRPFL